MTATDLDVLLIGAGLSGIGVGHYLRRECPKKRFAMLEARPSLGGTWDLFRYPGIRSDSRMPLYGYSFRPWREERRVASGATILQYLKDAARDAGLDARIRYGTRAVSAAWSSHDATWTVEAERADGERERYRTNWLQLCAGYYSYREGYTPEFPGREDFGGRIIHPQAWPEDFDPSGKRIVVIGSGATAVTLIPALAKQAAHVVMLQRSPTYIHWESSADPVARWLLRLLPADWAYALRRRKDRYVERLGYATARQEPEKLKRYLKRRLERVLPKGYDIARHFTPHYAPWDQRVCLDPDGELFAAIRSGRASVVTDRIERFTRDGIRLVSGTELRADVIVTATGLNMAIGGEMKLEIDGAPLSTRDAWIYKGVMLSGVPNLMLTAGTLIASYTLRVELIAKYLCRVLQHMDATGTRRATPTLTVDPSRMPKRPFVTGFNSGYLLRAVDSFPHQGDAHPWLNVQTYEDNARVLGGPVDDGVLRFHAR